ncbi:family 1 glycosylhydrolase, partial [Escherichia coli]|uniref:family 1 glycosylhydrolase n=1 Tax=Escherichia coli TaxID=562 RepID=UPI0039E1F0BB
DYAGVVAARFGDRVARWATLNEQWCAAFLGYASGVHAPGHREPAAAFASAHHLLLGHAWAREQVRSSSQGPVGAVLNL